MAKKKRRKEEFAKIGQDLGEQLFQQEVQKRVGWYGKILLVLLVLVIGSFVFITYRNHQSRDLTEKELVDYANHLVATESNFKYKWTFQDVSKLKFDSTGERGERLQSILSKYGRPNKVEVLPGMEAVDGFMITYTANKFDWSIPYQQVMLTFKKVKGVFRLVEYVAEGELTGLAYKADKNNTFRWTQQEFDNLIGKVFPTDKGVGLSYSEMVKRFGKPNDINYTLRDGYEIFHTMYAENVQEWNEHNHVYIMFQRDLKRNKEAWFTTGSARFDNKAVENRGILDVSKEDIEVFQE